MPWQSVIAAAAAFGVACATVRVLIRVAPRLGYIDHPAAHKHHATPTPLLGGLAVFAGWIAGALIIGGTWGPLRGTNAVWLVSGAAAVVLGMIDDRVVLAPKPKFVGLVLIAVLTAGAAWWRGGIGIPDTVAVACAALFFANAYNLLDNIDGLCASVGAATLLAVGVCGHAPQTLAAAASVVGFLVWNRPKAGIFLGDTGSLLIGIWCVVAAMTPNAGERMQVALPLAAFWVPMYDTLSVIVVRLRAGRSIAQGGQDHFSHRLMRRGWSAAGVDSVLGGLTLAVGIGSSFLPLAWQPAVAAGMCCAAGLFELLAPGERR